MKKLLLAFLLFIYPLSSNASSIIETCDSVADYIADIARLKDIGVNKTATMRIIYDSDNSEEDKAVLLNMINYIYDYDVSPKEVYDTVFVKCINSYN